MTAESVIHALHVLSSEEKSKNSERFFKTGKGEYGHGDVFMGVTVPEQRKIATQYSTLALQEIQVLLESKVHEARLTGLHILVGQYQKIHDPALVDFYLEHLRRVNNWDLVDSSAHHILGHYLLERDRRILYTLARSENLWERRVAIVATWAFIRKNDLQDTFSLAELLLSDTHDLTHKAVGWMLREAGKKDEQALRNFLKKHGSGMPRTMLRYAIERLDDRKELLEQTRQRSF